LKKVIIFAIIVAAAAGIYVALNRNGAEEPEIKYITVPVEKGTLKAEINSTGTLRPVVEVLVGTQVSGTIKELFADFETKVTKGQLIALIDPDKFEAKVNQARADLESATAGLNKAEVTLVDERRTLKRKETLIEGGSISQSEYDTAKTKADAAAAEVGMEKARVAQTTAKLREASLDLQYTRIVAPVNGVVTSRTGDVGQTVTASFQTPVLFKIAEDLKRMQVLTNVDEADVGRVREGQKAEFTVPAFPDQVFSASVSQIRNEPVVEQNVVTYIVVLDVDNDELKLRPGMTANVQILLSEVKDTLMVPDQAFRFNPAAGEPGVEAKSLPALKSGQRRVWRLERGNRLTAIAVRAGIAGTERVQIFSDRLKKGDKVVVEEIHNKKQSSKMKGLRFRF
jgi:HlyD family secretion protein